MSEKKKRGAPSKVKSLLNHPLAHSLIAELSKRDAKDHECAQRMCVSIRTWCRWKAANKDFWQSFRADINLDDADARVRASLYEQATGYYRSVTRFLEDGTKIVEEKYYPPSVQAQQFWLKNRKSNEWRDKIDIAASMEQIPVRINMKIKEKKVIEAEATIIPERKDEIEKTIIDAGVEHVIEQREQEYNGEDDEDGDDEEQGYLDIRRL